MAKCSHIQITSVHNPLPEFYHDPGAGCACLPRVWCRDCGEILAEPGEARAKLPTWLTMLRETATNPWRMGMGGQAWRSMS